MIPRVGKDPGVSSMLTHSLPSVCEQALPFFCLVFPGLHCVFWQEMSEQGARAANVPRCSGEHSKTSSNYLFFRKVREGIRPDVQQPYLKQLLNALATGSSW